jgi:O-antigen/teichoic acid export membrane protein
VLALALLVSSLSAAAEQGLRALNRAEVGFTANLLGLAVTLAATLWLLPSWGILGAAWGFLLGTVLNAAVRLFALVRLLAEPVAETEMPQ